MPRPINVMFPRGHLKMSQITPEKKHVAKYKEGHLIIALIIRRGT